MIVRVYLRNLTIAVLVSSMAYYAKVSVSFGGSPLLFSEKIKNSEKA